MMHVPSLAAARAQALLMGSARAPAANFAHLLRHWYAAIWFSRCVRTPATMPALQGPLRLAVENVWVWFRCLCSVPTSMLLLLQNNGECMQAGPSIPFVPAGQSWEKSMHDE